MRTFRLIAVFAFAAIFAVSAFAQVPTASSNFKIGVINTAAFDADKVGITKYVTAANSLETEFKPVMTELQTMATKLQALEADIKKAQETARASSSGVPVGGVATLQAKADEYEKLGRELKFKQEDAKARYERREAAVLSPIRNFIVEISRKNSRQPNDRGKLPRKRGKLFIFFDCL